MRLLLRSAVVLVIALSSACGAGDDTASDITTPRITAPTTTLRVLATSSLTEAFGDMEKAFETLHPTIDIQLSFAASSALAQQVLDDAPADVLATADLASMQTVIDAAKAVDVATIAHNQLAIIAGPGNPKKIAGLSDLARRGMVVVLCAPEVPCGKYAATALAKAKVSLIPASLEENVKGVVTKVTLREADAGIVYVTDVKAAGAKASGITIDIADDPDLVATYPMGAVASSSHLTAAGTWIGFVRSQEGQRILAKRGFLPA